MNSTQDTKIGGHRSQFPATKWSAIAAASSQDPNVRHQAFEVIARAYWKPVYKTIRIKWQKSNEDAKDLTQAFFTTVIEKDYIKNFDPTKARFRTFLRTCLRGFIANEEKAARRIKRGGNRAILSLDFDSADKELAFSELSEHQSLDEYFNYEWVRNLFSLAVEALRKKLDNKDKSVYFAIFERYDLNDQAVKATYDEIATEFKLPTTQVTNYLAYARREFRQILLEKLREITVTEAEFQSEARALLGVDI